MRFVVLLRLAIVLTTFATSRDVVAQQLEVRRVKDAIVQVRTDQGMSLLIQPNSESKAPIDLAAERSFVLGTEFDTTFMRTDGDSETDSLQLNPGDPVPPKIVSIESALIGTKQAGIQLKTNKLNILFASVDLMGDQSWITTHRDQDINLLVLTFKNAANLNTARMNLWLGLVKAQQIALNPLDEMSVDSMEKFYKSIGTKRVLPTGVLPMVQVPNRNLNFGDRQVVLLKEQD